MYVSQSGQNFSFLFVLLIVAAVVRILYENFKHMEKLMLGIEIGVIIGGIVLLIFVRGEFGFGAGFAMIAFGICQYFLRKKDEWNNM